MFVQLVKCKYLINCDRYLWSQSGDLYFSRGSIRFILVLLNEISWLCIAMQFGPNICVPLVTPFNARWLLYSVKHFVLDVNTWKKHYYPHPWLYVMLNTDCKQMQQTNAMDIFNFKTPSPDLYCLLPPAIRIHTCPTFKRIIALCIQASSVARLMSTRSREERFKNVNTCVDSNSTQDSRVTQFSVR